jgi:hypothetical protein
MARPPGQHHEALSNVNVPPVAVDKRDHLAGPLAQRTVELAFADAKLAGFPASESGRW